ncbi:MAG: hypothetical protein ACTH2U_17355 [Brevibacterium sp.]|uniref:Uncharacterized protein n=1 Tax=Brevibacterium linens ATCC 9172 TaxID=1255617 RepID=A0A2H1K7G0_BRELN|nr:hypothetical protein [Brevibacterium linens]AZT99644.1 hypothetical protein CXR29_02025 [Brevibacterium linens]KAB1946279.1 hypothetical protein F8227_12905 [Brevibacterium linens ATCC 9172]SMX95653.1 hypothetical protein BLIN9172_02887 [Brevibacterium linens ATCC 9172]
MRQTTSDLSQQDLEDARVILEVLKLVHQQRGNRGAAGRKLLRHATDAFWDKPRETRQGHRRRVDGALWSPAAFARANHPEPRLVGEHVYPMKLRIAGWYERLDNQEVPTAAEIAADLLATPWAIITGEEDEKLTRAKLRDRMPEDWDGHDLWARYRHPDVALDVDGFRPFPQQKS